MSGRNDSDRCPFCNAVWDNCSHIKLLLALEAETSDNNAPDPRGCTSFALGGQASDKSPVDDCETGQGIDQNKPLVGSWRVAR